MSKKKKSPYALFAEAIANEKGLKNVPFSTKEVNHRRLTVDEIKEHIVEEFGDVSSAADADLQEPPGGWSDAEIENEIEWVKALNLEEAFGEK